MNLIGEHTDYCGGLVLPVAIDRATCVAAAPGAGGVLRCWSEYEPYLSPAVVPLSAVGSGTPEGAGGWVTYVAGVAWALAGAGVGVVPADLFVASDVPVGAGLSSSAALQVALAAALAGLSGAALPAADVAAVARRAENDFVGVPTGMMDQAVVAGGRAGHALFLDTRSGESRFVPFNPDADGVRLVVVDTAVRRRLADGRYAERRRQCEEAATALGDASLRDVSPNDIAACAALEDVLRRRARHVVTENRRVVEVVDALEAGDFRAVGSCLLQSHASLRDDYEVSCPELDLAVETAVAAGALGARMTGAGFGGCAIALVPDALLAPVAGAVDAAFSRHGFRAPSAYPVAAADGVRRLP